MSLCRVISCVVGNGIFYDQCILMAKLLVFALLHFVLQGQACLLTPSISCLLTFAFQSPMMKRTSFWVLVLEGLVALHRTIHLQLLWCCSWITVILNDLPWK